MPLVDLLIRMKNHENANASDREEHLDHESVRHGRVHERYLQFHLRQVLGG